MARIFSAKSLPVYVLATVILVGVLHLLSSTQVTSPPTGASYEFRLIQSTHNSSNHIRQAELTTVLSVNRLLFNDLVVTTERRFDALLSLLAPNKVNIIANGDIMFDASIYKSKVIDENTMFALSRYEMHGQIVDRGGADSQDVWIFRGQATGALKSRNLSFSLGYQGCDNRFAWEAQQAGYNVTNPSLSIKVWHYHCSSVRTYTPAERVPGPYHLIVPSSLQEHYAISLIHLSGSAKKQRKS